MEETKGERSAVPPLPPSSPSQQEPFVLQAFIHAHTSDLRCMCAGEQHLLTGGRDCQLAAFEVISLVGVEVQPAAVLKLDTWINALLTVPDESIIVCGCNDTIIYLIKWEEGGAEVMDTSAESGGGGSGGGSGSRRRMMSIVGAVTGHSAPIASLSWLSSCAPGDDSLLLSGGWDDTARLWNLEDGSCLYVFEPQENIVSVLGLDILENDNKAADSGGSSGGASRSRGGGRCLITGSTGCAIGDKVEGQQIRVWRETQDHKGLSSTSSSATSPSTSSSTSSSSTSLTSWKMEASFKDHSLGIRDLCKFPLFLPYAFGSCSNDGTVRLWWRHSSEYYRRQVHIDDVPPVVLGEEGGAFVYSLCWSDVNKVIIAVDDEGCLRMWNIDASLRQCIRQPCCIWCTATAGRLICSGDSKGKLRVYSTDVNLKLPEGIDREAQEEGSRRGHQHQHGGGAGGGEEKRFISTAELDKYSGASPAYPTSTSSSLSSSSSLEGLPPPQQVSIFHNPTSGKLEVYKWDDNDEGSSRTKKWELVGVVTDPIPIRPKHFLDGEMYDVIIPVEIDSASKGFLQLRLGINVGDNPDDVSAAFCKRHDLPVEYYPQIADFIRVNML